MNIIDIAIILILVLGAVVGFKRGFFRQTVQSIGGILVVIFALIFTKSLAGLLVRILPAFNFKGIFDGISSMNILVYYIIAFLLLLLLFGIVFRLLLMLATFIENFLKATILLAIPSKILGAIMGLIEYYLIVFVLLYIFTLPLFNISIINESKFKDRILEGTPIVSSLAGKAVNSFKDIYALKDELANSTDRLKLDEKILKILIDNKIITAEKAQELYSEGKIKTN